MLTGVNLTTYKLVLNRFPVGDDVTMTAAKWRHQGEFYSTVYDTLLTLYNGLLLRSHDGLCQWTGREHLLSTLVKVTLLVSRDWRDNTKICFKKYSLINDFQASHAH